MLSRLLLTIVMVCALAGASVSAQSLDVTDVDLSAWPDVSARLLALDGDWQPLTGLTPADVTLTVNGVPRPVTLVDCPPLGEPTRLSSVLTIDISGSMAAFYMPIARRAAHAWIDALPSGGSECAITSFNHASYIVHGFTTDKPRLHAAVDGLDPEGGTNYDEAFLGVPGGGLPMAERGRYRRVLVLLTDGTSTGDRDAIIARARASNTVVYCVTLGMPMPKILKEIAEATGGAWYADVVSAEDAERIYRRILYREIQYSGCRIAWRDADDCSPDRVAAFAVRGARDTLHYSVPVERRPRATVTPTTLDFGPIAAGNTGDLTATVTAVGRDITVNAVTPSPATSPFTWISPAPPFTVRPGTPVTVTVRYAPVSAGLASGRFVLSTDCGDVMLYAAGGADPTNVAERTIRLVTPNGGEEFLVGDTVMLRWEGVTPETEVTLDVSPDAGATWKKLAERATGLSFRWIAEPPTSRRYLARVSQNDTSSGTGLLLKPSGSGVHGASNIRFSIDGSATVLGAFESSLDFGSGGSVGTAGQGDLFLARLDPDGRHLWSKNIGGILVEEGRGLDVDDAGTTVVAGTYRAALDIGGGNVAPVYVGDATVGNVFIAKFAPDGAPVWLASGGGPGRDDAVGVSLDAAGNAYVAGMYIGNGFRFGTFRPTAAGNADVFVSKLDAATGEPLWLTTFASNGGQFAHAIAADAGGSSIVVGSFEGAMTVGSNALSNRGGWDGFIAKLSTTGDPVWGVQMGGAGSDGVYRVATDGDGNAYVSGMFEGTVQLGDSTVVAAGPHALLVAKLDPNGRIVWIRQIPGTSAGGSTTPADVAVDSRGRLVVSMTYGGDVTLGGRTYSDPSGYDVLVATYDLDGGLLGVVTTDGTAYARGGSATYDPFDRLWIVGDSQGDETFGSEGSMSTQRLNAFIWRIGGARRAIQADSSDNLWAIVQPVVTARDIEMGTLLVGHQRDSVHLAVVTNSGTGTIRVDTVFVEGGDAGDFEVVSRFDGFALDEGTSREIEFRFSASAVGERRSTVVIVTQSDTLRRTITGTGVAPQLELLAPLIDFGVVQVGSSRDTIAVIVRNIGTADAHIEGGAIGGPGGAQFSAPDGVPSFSLKPGETARIRLRFTPADTSSTSAVLALRWSGSEEPVVVHLLGAGETARATLVAPELHAAPGETVDVPITLRNASLLGAGANAFIATLSFNATLLALEGSTPAGVVTGEEVRDGLRVLTITTPATPISDSTLAVLHMRAALGNDSLTSLTLSGTEVHGVVGTVRGEAGFFRLDSICIEGGARLLAMGPGALRRITLAPNPVRGMTAITYDVDEAGIAVISLVDARGGRLELLRAHHRPGTYAFDFDASLVPSGLYHCELRLGHGTAVVPVVVVK